MDEIVPWMEFGQVTCAVGKEDLIDRPMGMGSARDREQK